MTDEEMILSDAFTLMTSDDYKDRFKAEYLQTKIRYERLHRIIIKHEAGTLDFELKSAIGILQRQANYMGLYLHCLEVRAEIEGIDLTWQG